MSSLVSDSLAVLTIFLVPFGGGIPAGVLVAQSKGLTWPLVSFLYFVSDVILAIAFEPFMHFLIHAAKRSNFLTNVGNAYKKSMALATANYGLNPSPFVLVMISFGVDPMTGRVAARAAGHGFFSGWAIAICGDMIFFAVIMASTLWLNNILGDGTTTAVIIMVAMIGIPPLIRRIRRAIGARVARK